MKKKMKIKPIAPQKLDSFTRMAYRVVGTKKMRRQLESNALTEELLSATERKYIQKVVKSFKGSQTLFTRECRPDAQIIMESLNDFYDQNKQAKIVECITQESGKPIKIAKHSDEHPCFTPINEKEFPSLHDSHLCEWHQGPDELSIVFDGYFDTTGNQGVAGDGFMEVRFKNPTIEVLLRGLPAQLSKQAETGSFMRERGYNKESDPYPMHQQRPFASYSKKGQSCMQGFDQLLWIHDEERSLSGEPLCWKILFGSNSHRGMEMAIYFEAIEFTFGQAQIRARREAEALKKELDTVAPAMVLSPKIKPRI